MEKKLTRLTLILTILIISLTTIPLLSGKWPGNVMELKIESGRAASIRGNLKGGKKISLRFASSSSVACFPATQNTKFRNNHIFYAFSIPAYSRVRVSAAPVNSSDDINIYGLQIGSGSYSRVPPNITSAVTCESGLSYRGGNPGVTEKISFNSIRKGYNIIVGISAPAGKTDIPFILKIDMRTTPPEDHSIRVNPHMEAKALDVTSGKILKIKDNLEGGYRIPLRWASTSQVACFPATQNEKFRGSHKFYRIKLPSYSKLKISLKSDSSINLYAMRLSAGDYSSLPPVIPTAVCEASYPYRKNQTMKSRNVSFIALRNPYTILIGIAGARGVESGEFEIEIGLKKR